MAAAQNPPLESKWAPLVPQPAPTVAAAPPPPPVSPRRKQPVAELRRDASTVDIEDRNDLIVWDSESSEGYISFPESGEEALQHSQIVWDSESSEGYISFPESGEEALQHSQIVWDADAAIDCHCSSSEDEETAEDGITKDTNPEFSIPDGGVSPILSSFVTPPVNKPQGSLGTSLLAIPTEKPIPTPNNAVPSQSAVPPALLRPQNVGFQSLRTMPNGSMALAPPIAPPAAALSMAQDKPAPMLLDASNNVSTPSFNAPTYLIYPIGPAISSLVSDTVEQCNNLIQPRNEQIDGDGDELPEHGYYKSENLSDEEKAKRNKELVSHAKMLKRSLTNTRVGIEISRSKADMTINQERDRIVQLIKKNSAVVIAAATGSGKTTQLPQIILEDAIELGTGADCNVWVTQPRRVSATSVARRVTKERFDGGVLSVGHHVKFDVHLPRPGGSITYCTTGILLNRIQRRPGEVFDNISHIIVDEAHERDMLIDRLLAFLKFHLFARKKAGLKFPKVIVSSATLDIDLFTKYFAQPVMENGVRGLVPCPYLDIPGRMFPVKYTYLTSILLELDKYPSGSRFFMEQEKATQDFIKLNKEVPSSRIRQSDAEEAIVPFALIALTIAHIVRTTTEGAILVFLPGLDSITKVRTSLEVNSPMIGVDFGNQNAFRILILHSDMKESNDEAFDKMPNGVRKIVLATNIAETSITIPDAVYVIDSGKHKEMVYEPERGLSQLRCGWISQSSCKQRAGRSGRVQNGFYYAMYTKQRFDTMRATTKPEILRSELQEICLQLAHQPFDSSVRDFLNSLIEPPDHKAVDTAFIALKHIDALTDDEQITALGRVLASLPVHPARAKMIVLGIVFRCLDPMLILAAANSLKEMFLRPLERRQEAKAARIRFSADSNSDHLALINAVDQARALAERTGPNKCREFLVENFVHFNQWREVCRTAELMEQILIDRRLIPWFEPGGHYWKYGSPELNTNSSNQHLIKALIIAGYHPNVAASHGLPMMRSLHAERIFMSGASVNQEMMKLAQRGQLYTFSEITKAANGIAWTMRDNSTISPLGAILFARSLKRVRNRQLLVDGWLQFTLPSEDDATALVKFKNIIDNVLADAYKQLGGVRKQIADDPVREKLSRVIGASLFQDTKAYEQYLERQPAVARGSKGKKRNRGNRKSGGQDGQNGHRRR